MDGRPQEIETTQEHNTSLDRRELFAAYISREPYVFEIMEILSDLDIKSRKLILSIAQVLDVVSMSENREEQSSGGARDAAFLAMPFLNSGYTKSSPDQFLP